jgi:CubicO group peptidase (beta-lactamase class C family)
MARRFVVPLMFALLAPATVIGSGDTRAMPTKAATSEQAQCGALGLTQCPAPFDSALPPAKDMLTWTQSFGLFVAGGGRLPDGTELLPRDWLAQSTAWTHAKGSVDESNPNGQYGYQWWHAAIPKGADANLKALANRTLWAEGIFGQVIAIDPSQHVVMVQWSTYAEAEGSDELGDEQLFFLRALEESLGVRP